MSKVTTFVSASIFALVAATSLTITYTPKAMAVGAFSGRCLATASGYHAIVQNARSQKQCHQMAQKCTANATSHWQQNSGMRYYSNSICRMR
jgi:hypothetical protein|tara:strand:+ start:1966 stop:2241 length:276 start_codon:yes stop_codon:yes gene_type:complete